MYTTNVDKEIENEIIELNKKLFKIKREGWHKSVRKGPTGIGKTLETLLDKEEDRKSLPDYKHFEIKAKKYGSKSYTTLFNLTPKNDSDKNEIKRLVEKYGYPDKVLKNKKVLQNEIYFTNKTLIGNRYYFKLTIKKEKLYISVYYKNNILKKEIA